MEDKSVKEVITDYLEGCGNWQYGGIVEDHVRKKLGSKASNASRRCRELEDEHRIEARYVKVEGVGNKVVQYRVKREVLATLF